MQENKKFICGLTLISSSICNLNCSFCFLNKNSSFQEFNKMVSETWKNKTYLKNVAASLVKINADLNDIQEIELWGGEPLLSIEQIIPNIPDFYLYFKNLKNWSTSTNFTTNMEQFTNFIIELDKYAHPDSFFRLQLSIDGPEGFFTENGHNVSWDTYYNQFDKLINNLNKVKLHNIKIKIFIRPTVDEHYFLNYFSSLENIKEYFLKMDSLKQHILEKIGNNNSIIWMSNTHFPSTTVPSTASVEDGIKYGEIERLYQYLKFNDLKNNKDAQITNMFDSLGNTYDMGYSLNKPNLECCELGSRLTIWPDGTIVECGSCFMLPYNKYQSYLKENNEIDDYHTAEIGGATAYNPLSMSYEEIQAAEWYSRTGFKNNFSTYYSLLLALADEMALSGQIPYKYHLNPELFLKQVAPIMVNFFCTRDNTKTTRISYLAPPATIRKFFNGLIDYISEIKRDQMNE